MICGMSAELGAERHEHCQADDRDHDDVRERIGREVLCPDDERRGEVPLGGAETEHRSCCRVGAGGEVADGERSEQEELTVQIDALYGEWEALSEELTALDAENVGLNQGVMTYDFGEALKARKEKRPPVFRGE